MLALVRSAAVLGIEAYDVTVEVDVALGLPAFAVVGLATGAAKESRERVAAAIVNSGFVLPPRRVTTSLAPAGVTKARTCPAAVAAGGGEARGREVASSREATTRPQAGPLRRTGGSTAEVYGVGIRGR